MDGFCTLHALQRHSTWVAWAARAGTNLPTGTALLPHLSPSLVWQGGRRGCLGQRGQRWRPQRAGGSPRLEWVWAVLLNEVYPHLLT